MKLNNTRILFVAAIITLSLVGGGFLAYKWFAPAPSLSAGSVTLGKNGVPQSDSIEERWGIRVSQVGVTADGGLIDFRYVVLDPNKALDWQADLKNVPSLVVEGSGAIVSSAALMPHKQDMAAGRTYFLLYRNTRSAIKQGSKISVVIGDLKLDGVPVL